MDWVHYRSDAVRNNLSSFHGKVHRNSFSISSHQLFAGLHRH
jgi:hypothetical protein